MKRTALAVCLAAAFCGRASGMHPLVSEDTGFLGKGGRQVELGLEHAVSREGPDIYSNSLCAEISYGLNERADLLFTVPWQGWSSAGVSESGPGDLALETKLRVAEKAGWTFAVKPGLSLATGDHEKGLGSGKTDLWAYAIAGRTSGPWQFFLNAGYFLNKNSAGEEAHILKGSAAVVLEAAPRTLVTADLTTETSADPDASSHPLSSIFGVAWSPADTLDLDAGVKLGLNDAADDLGLLAGATFRF
ncbi:MAG: transporter [Elusimicrobiales bacterium]|nr:transporter [Elusimicrobiales bacterium]